MASAGRPPLDQAMDPLASFTADGAYDQERGYGDVAAWCPDGAVIVPPRCNAVPSGTAGTVPGQRDRPLQHIAEHGGMRRQRTSGCHRLAPVRADMSRFKRAVGDALRSRTKRHRATEVAIAVGALGRMLDLGRPSQVRLARATKQTQVRCPPPGSCDQASLGREPRCPAMPRVAGLCRLLHLCRA